MWVFQRSLRSWLLVVVPPRSTSAMTPRPGPSGNTKSGRARVGDESVAGCQDDFLAEPEVFPQQGGDDQLDGAALRPVDVYQVDLGRAIGQMRLELQCEGID